MNEYQQQRVADIVVQWHADNTMSNRDFMFILQSLRDAWACLKTADQAVRRSFVYATDMEDTKR